MTVHNGLRLAEVAEALGAIGAVLMVMGNAVPFGRRGGGFLGGLAIAVAFVLLIIATHWGHFG